MHEHTDVPPNKYKALSMWGVDGLSGQFVAYSFDNFKGTENLQARVGKKTN